MLGSASAPFLAGGIGRLALRGVFLIDAFCCLLADGVIMMLMLPRRGESVSQSTESLPEPSAE